MSVGTRAHWVPGNAVTRIPRCFIYLDAEANQRAARKGVIQSFRLAVAACDRRSRGREPWQPREWCETDDVGALWDWIDGRCKARQRTVLVAHKLDYDLRITDGVRHLLARGWKCETLRLDSAQVFGAFRNGERSLMLVDSMSWLAMSLERLGPMVGMSKLDLPAWEEDNAAWFARCRRDVEILAAVYQRLMEWVRADDLGNWKPTGAGQSWAAFRHRFMEHRILVHEDDDARSAEREAAYAGRCEAWKHGRLRGGPFTEWDYTTAYALIGAECEVPTRLIGERSKSPSLFTAHPTPHRATLMECEVSTEVPTVPTRHEGHIMWPVGTFRTTLWDHEARMAIAYGATVRSDREWVYETTPALAQFCRWVLAIIGSRDDEHDAVVRAAAKHWSRALIGRFGSRWVPWEACGESDTHGLEIGDVIDASTGERWRYMQIGRQITREGIPADAPDAVPAIMSWVMAEARVRLWRAIIAAGREHVAYMDTDSILTTEAGSQRLRKAALAGLRVKSVWDSGEVLGPRQIVLEGRLRAAGISRGAVKVAPDTWEADVWEQIGTSFGRGEGDRVRIVPRLTKLRGTDRRRVKVDGGLTVPVRLGLDAVSNARSA